MPSATFVSRFTPSLMSPETIEALFVQRQSLAESIMLGIRESATTDAKHYVLLVGPRGVGKTHFATLIRNRVVADADLRQRLCVAWLREEERGITSFADLLIRILQALARDEDGGELLARTDALYDLPRGRVEESSRDLLLAHLAGRTLLMIVENLDAIFTGLNKAGQQALRAFLQNQACTTILATAPALFSGVSAQTSPCYGLFTTHHLEELTANEAVDLLAHIAEVRQDHELARFVRTPAGRARIRAVHHLAGGNHRVYVVFSDFLTCETLDELVDPFMRMLDDLTPYYQDCLNKLPPQQQALVEFLAHTRGALTVKEIARRCLMTQQTAAGQLLKLHPNGFVRAISHGQDKRETYYELREPLMRLCFEVKEYRGEPIGLFVDFLVRWYGKDELEKRLSIAPQTALMERACIEEALRRLEEGGRNLRVTVCRETLDKAMSDNDYATCLEVTEELVELEQTVLHYRLYAIALIYNKKLTEAQGAARMALNLITDGDTLDKFHVGHLCSILDLYNEAISLLSGLDPANITEFEVDYYESLGRSLFAVGRYEESIPALTRSLESGFNIEDDWLRLIMSLQLGNRHEDALEVGRRALRENKAGFELVMALSTSFIKLGLFNEYNVFLEEWFRNADDTAGVCWFKCLTHILNGNPRAAMDCYTRLYSYQDYDESFGDYREPLETISAIFRSDVSSSTREQWVADWEKLAEQHPKLQPAVEMLRAAVTYYDTRDERGLLALPSEMRSIVLEELAKLDIHPQLEER